MGNLEDHAKLVELEVNAQVVAKAWEERFVGQISAGTLADLAHVPKDLPGKLEAARRKVGL